METITIQKNELPEGWEIVKLGDTRIAKITSGGTPKRDKKEYFNGKIFWVKSGEVKENILVDSEEKITKEALENSSAKILPKDTVLIAMYGANVGRTAILGVEATTVSNSRVSIMVSVI